MRKILYYLRTKKLQFMKKFYTNKVRKQCKKCGKDLMVNFPSYVTGNTIIKNNVNFNGMTIRGNGIVIIGNYFHSGEDCFMVS